MQRGYDETVDLSDGQCRRRMPCLLRHRRRVRQGGKERHGARRFMEMKRGIGRTVGCVLFNVRYGSLFYRVCVMSPSVMLIRAVRVLRRNRFMRMNRPTGQSGPSHGQHQRMHQRFPPPASSQREHAVPFHGVECAAAVASLSTESHAKL